MRTVFVDTAAWLGLVLPKDQHNARANAFLRTLGRGNRLLTSNYVLSETDSWLRYREPFQTLQTFHRRTQSAQSTGFLKVLWIERQVYEQSWETMRRYSGRRLSLCDCSSFVLCEQEQVDEVFTFDSDFRQMGFTVKP